MVNCVLLLPVPAITGTRPFTKSTTNRVSCTLSLPVTVDTENKIRKALGGNGYEIKKQDGTVAQSGTLLPSAFFKVKKAGNIFKIIGGGYGHGIGMSQNGANEMAKKGKNYQEILKMFYPGTTIEK